MAQAVDLIPLGVIHTETYDYCRERLMEIIRAEWQAGRLTLWGYCKGGNWSNSKPIPYPDTLELELAWFAGPDRTDGSNPRFPGLAYYCDVSAYHHSNPKAYFWTELLIASGDLDRLRAEIPEAAQREFQEWRTMTGYPPTGTTLNETEVVANTVHCDSEGAMPCRSDIWLTPAQSVYFLATGENLAEVASLSEVVVLVRLARITTAFVPLSTEAGPEERAAALKAVKQQLRLAGKSPLVAAVTKWRDQLLATGVVLAEGRRTPFGAYETIKPVEFCDLTLAGPHAESRQQIVFYAVRLSGRDLSRARPQALALITARKHRERGELVPFNGKAETIPSSLPANALPRPTVQNTELRVWYANHIATSQPTSEAVDWEAAKRQFGAKVRRQQVRALRHELAPEDWRRQGRRKAAQKSAD
jgi:hypothetical protein